MKLYGIFGKGTGRKGDAVFAIAHGVQIVRQYNPVVLNPKSTKQVDVRSRLKLLSQLSAVMGKDIAIQRIGLKSARNQYVSINFPLSYTVNDAASIDLAKVQLTKSHVGMTMFGVDRTDGEHINVALGADSAALFDRVVYVAYIINPDQSLQKLGDIVVSNAGANGLFSGALPYSGNGLVVYAYGIKDLNDRASVMFGNLKGVSSEGIARLLTSRALRATDAQVTETVGCYLQVGETSGESEDVERARVILSSVGNGTVTGAGTYIVGTTVTIHASAGENAEFAGWYDGGVDGRLVSSEPDYTFTVNENVNYVAKFLGAPVTVSVTANPSNRGTVSGGGSFEAGTSVTVHATPNTGSSFVGWYEGDTLKSSARDYTFIANTNVSLEARFEESQTPLVTVTSSPSGRIENITGDGEHTPGEQVQVTCTVKSAYVLDTDVANPVTLNGQAVQYSTQGSVIRVSFAMPNGPAAIVVRCASEE